MHVGLRQFCFLFIIFLLIDIVIRVFYSIHARTDDKPTKKQGPGKYKYGRPVVLNVSQNMKILYDLIICNPRDVENVNLKNEENLNVYTNASNFLFQYNFNSDIEKGNLKRCPLYAPGLGPVADDQSIWSLLGIDDMYLWIQPGGVFLPTECVARQQVAIIVPVHKTLRIKTHYITSFLYYIHPFLMKQQLEYQIFVILKPNATTPYERGKLFNIGFKEAQTYRPGGWGCIVFHDPHLVPLDTRNLYRCSQHPRMLKSVLQKPYKFGGAVAIRPRHFVKANGFSNLIWSNDGDYIDMYKRLRAANLTVESNVPPIGNYTYFEALRQENNEFEKIQTNPCHYLKDGLSTVSYNIKNTMKLQQFYTLVEVEDF